MCCTRENAFDGCEELKYDVWMWLGLYVFENAERLEWRECGGGDKCKRRVLVFARYRQESSRVMTLLKGFASEKHN